MKPTSCLGLLVCTLCYAVPVLQAVEPERDSTIVVSTTRDSGQGSLRAALEKANRHPGTHILFRIPRPVTNGTLSQRPTLIPLSPLPVLRGPNTRIEGDSQVTIEGNHANIHWIGLRIAAPQCHISGINWRNWPAEAIAIQTDHTTAEGNGFDSVGIGIKVQGTNARKNRFENNVFDAVKTPIELREGANDGIKAPTLTITRNDGGTAIKHKFTVAFQGKPETNVTLELNYSPREAYQSAQIQRAEARTTLKTDRRGNALWQFERKGYPVGSWSVTGTQEGNTSPFSSSVVLPYL